MRAILFIILISLLIPAFADKSTPHPITEKPVAQFILPQDLASISTDELVTIKDEYIENLKQYQRIADKHKMNSKKLMQALQQYDIERSKIVDVIHQLIDAYQVDKKIAEQMAAYANRFKTIHNTHKGNLENFKDYKSYDFQLGVTYASFLKMIQNVPALYQRLETDMDNPKTVIGSYIANLEKVGNIVDQASNDIQEVHIIYQIETSIKRLDQELISRI